MVPQPSGINRGELLPLRTLGERLGLRQYALDELRKKGLPTIKTGNRVFALSDDVLDFFRRLPPSGASPVC